MDRTARPETSSAPSHEGIAACCPMPTLNICGSSVEPQTTDLSNDFGGSHLMVMCPGLPVLILKSPDDRILLAHSPAQTNTFPG